jgi:phage tail-like protein
MDFPTAHALLRDRRHWRGSLLGVTSAEDGGPGDGELVLARVPAPANGKPVTISTPLPYPREVSGIAAGPCQSLFVADTAHDRILYIDGQCDAQAWLPPLPVPWTGAPGTFRTPRALACAADALLVADSGNARVQSLAFPQLEAHLAWTGWSEPVSLAIDSKHRVLVIDAGTRALHRASASGSPDGAFDAAVAASGRLAHPQFVACDAEDRVLVADVQNNEVIVFDSAGGVLYALPGIVGWLPGALASWGAQVYVADAASGLIVVFVHDAVSAHQLGTLDGWQGPVTALAVDAGGTLYIKPGLDTRFYRFAADGAFLSSGTLSAGPFDAGEDREWERAFADTVLPANTSLALEVATASSDATPPGAADWVLLPAPDALLSRFTPAGRRFAWLRLTLASTDSSATPRVRQARLATAAEDYLDYLPLTYRYNDAGADGLLSRWLRLMRGEFSRIEELLDGMPRLADPRFEPADSLDWLAQWFGLELPQIADDAQRRALVARAVSLMARRGTRQSIAEFVELHTGITPAIVEGFADRRIWVLGRNSLLDFDTRLAPLDPLGMVVPDPAQEAGCCPAVAAPADTEPRSACVAAANEAAPALPVLAIGRAVVGESGPLAQHQIGLPLYAEDAYRFCVVVDGYRAADSQIVQEIGRIVEREKPAHTDWRLELVAPELRVGLQARIGIDAIVGGAPPPALGGAQLSVTTRLPPSDAARVGEAMQDGSLTLT